MLVFFILFLVFYLYLTPIGFIRMDFKNHPKSSLIETVGSSVGLISSLCCFIINAIPNVSDSLYMPIFSFTFSLIVFISALLIVCNGVKFNEQILKNKTIDIITKIISLIVCSIIIITSIIVGLLI